MKEKKFVAKYQSTEDKRKVMKNKKKLGEARIYIDNDLTIKERITRDRVIYIKAIIVIIVKAKELKKDGGRRKRRFNKVGENKTWILSEKKIVSER